MVNPFNGEGIAYGYESGRLAAAVLGEALLANDNEILALYDERLNAAYGDYYRVARAFVRLISDPKVMQVCVSTGMRIPDHHARAAQDHGEPDDNDDNGPGEDRIPRDDSPRRSNSRTGVALDLSRSKGEPA